MMLAGVTTIALGAVLLHVRDAHAAYYVYCANNKIEVAQSNPQQMRSARGSGVCMLSQFNFLGDAQSFAQRNFGGQGRPCSCR
jgi:hypothetical protein